MDLKASDSPDYPTFYALLEPFLEDFYILLASYNIVVGKEHKDTEERNKFLYQVSVYSHYLVDVYYSQFNIPLA